MKFYNHKIGPNSSLRLLPDSGYKLIRLLSTIPDSGLVPFRIPPRFSYIKSPSYSTTFIRDVTRLNAPSPYLRDIWINSSIFDLARMFICLRNLKKRLPASYLENCNSLRFLKKIEDRILRDEFSLEDDRTTNIVRNIVIAAADSSAYLSDGLIHSDVHGGNYIAGIDACGWIDIENLTVGPLYTDFILYMFLNDLCSSKVEYVTKSLYDTAHSLSLRHPSVQDLAAALKIVLFHKYHPPSAKYFESILRRFRLVLPILTQKFAIT